MSPLLPDFTIHDLIPRKDSKVEEHLDNVRKSTEFVLGIAPALTGEDGWLMVPVINSTNILEIGFKENKCRVKFKGLKLFEYEPISEELWMKFLIAKSKGQFFSEHIRNNKEIKVKQVI